MIEIVKSSGDWVKSECRALLSEAEHQISSLLCLTNAPIISVLLTDDREISDLNRRFRQIDRPTNILSWPSATLPLVDHDTPFDPKNIVQNEIGDLAFGYETIIREADQAQLSWQDHFLHLGLHGILHLLGFDHQSDSSAQEMEAVEVKALEILDKHNPYSDRNH